MNYQVKQERPYTIYPGEYIPLPETEIMLENLSMLPRNVMKPIPLKVLECDDCFKIDVALPGVRREEIMLSVQDSTLSVAILPMHDIGPVDQQVFLPEYIEPEFVTATFNMGILHIYLPKSSSPSGLKFHPVAIY